MHKTAVRRILCQVVVGNRRTAHAKTAEAARLLVVAELVAKFVEMRAIGKPPTKRRSNRQKVAGSHSTKSSIYIRSYVKCILYTQQPKKRKYTKYSAMTCTSSIYVCVLQQVHPQRSPKWRLTWVASAGPRWYGDDSFGEDFITV